MVSVMGDVVATALEILEKTGLVGYCLAGMSILMLTITFAKLLQLLLNGSFSTSRLNAACQLIDKGLYDQAHSLLDRCRHPGAPILIAALVGAHQADSKEDLDLVDREVERQGSALYSDLTGGLKLLGLIATLSPLLGLLGTVLGMIGAFQAMESAGAAVDASLLSGGIWEALLTTALGLVVAIPATLFHSYLQGRAGAVLELVTDRVNWIFFRLKGDNAVLAPSGRTETVPAPTPSLASETL